MDGVDERINRTRLELLSPLLHLAMVMTLRGVVALGVITAAASGHVLARGETGLVAVASRVPSEALQLAKPANKMAAFYAVLTVAVAAMV